MRCPVCGKKFSTLWPKMWRYKRGNQFLCSYGCMRRMDKGETRMEKFTKEQKEKAVQIALEGGDPKAYLKSIGSANPNNMWYYLKTQLRKKEPETWERLAGARRPVETPEGEYAPAPIGGGKWEKMETPEDVPTVKVDGPLRIETEAPDMVEVETTGTLPDVTQPVVFDGMIVREIEGSFGRYRRSDVSKEIYIDFDFKDINDTISMTVDQWRLFQAEIERAAAILGVKL